MHLLIASAALAFTDTIGGDDVNNNDSEMLKLVILEVTDAAAITDVGFAASSRSATGEVVIALYEEVDGAYELVGEAPAIEPEAGQLGWASAAGLAWLVEPGHTYALGAWVGDGWSYYYDEDDTVSPWFADVGGSYRVEQELPDAFVPGDREAYYYWMRIGSTDADADGDGVAGGEYGGVDCDDADPSVGAPEDEVPYDGVDQDCDGVDMNDIDHDGSVGSEAGGPDCDDSSPAVAPGNAEVCGDGLDNDCVGGDGACAEDTGGDALDGDSVDISTGSCASVPGSAGAALGLLLAAGAAAARRRR